MLRNGIFSGYCFFSEQTGWQQRFYKTETFLAMNEDNVHMNEKLSRFELRRDDEIAFLDYKWHRDKLWLIHTFVPPSIRGKGLSFVIAAFALEYAKRRNVKLIVQCPVVARYLKLHPEYKSIVEKIRIRLNK
jgi:hypothetical protein